MIKGGEVHHILPRCMNGDDSQSNLIRLTEREHFICHLLLQFMTNDSVRHKLTFAAHITSCAIHGRKNRLHSRSYEIIRKRLKAAFQNLWADPTFRAEQSAIRKANMANPLLLARISEAVKKNRWDEVENSREEFSEAMLQCWQDPVYQATISEARLKTWADPEFQEKMSQTHKTLWQTAVHRETMRSRDEQMKLLWQDPAFREKQSASRSNSWTPERKAKHAAKISAINAGKRAAGIKGKPHTAEQKAAASQRWTPEQKEAARQKALVSGTRTPEELAIYKEECRQRYLKSLAKHNPLLCTPDEERHHT